MGRPIRVLHVTGSLGYGGVPLMLKTYYEAINKEKYQFDFLHHGDSENYHDKLIALGANIFRIDTLGKQGILSYVKNIIDVIKNNGPYDIVHIHTNYQAGIVAYAAKKSGIKERIIHMRGVDLPTKKIKYMFPFFKYMINKYGTERIANSELCGKFYFGKRNFSVFKNAISLDNYLEYNYDDRVDNRRKLGVNDEIVISQIGRMSKEKNHTFSLKLFNYLHKHSDGKRYKLLFIGDGILRDNLEEQAKSFGIYENISFLGVREDIPQLLTATDIMLLPSHSEGFGNVVLQAQAMGVPSVVSDRVPIEVDMGLGLVKFIGINKDSDMIKWKKNIENIETKRVTDKILIKDKIIDKGYDLKTSIKVLESYYMRLAIKSVNQLNRGGTS